MERLRRYTFIGPDGLTLFEPGLGALEIFLTARRFMYQQVYFHRTVRAIDLDLADVFGPSVRAIFGDGSPADRLTAYADLDEYALLHQAARWARGADVAAEPEPGDGRVTAAVAAGWSAILLRQPSWRSEAEIRVEYEADARPDAEKVEELFLWAVARPPTPAQREKTLAHIASHAKDKKVAYENILWALINTKEFVFVQ